MKTKYLPQIFFLLVLCVSFVPHNAQALAVPPADLFQLPWQLGESWIAMSGFDNGTLREKSSPHNYNQGGAVDFAPHVGMKIGEDTSNAWVTAAAGGRVIETSYCHIKIDHGNGWTTEYYHLGNIQVTKGAVVERNQKLAIIDNNANGQICVGNRWPGPHLHFVLRPNMRGATFAGWMVNYDSKTNITTFTKNGQTLGLFQPILNQMSVLPPTTETPTVVPTTETPIPTTETPTVAPTTETPVPTTETPTVVPTTETPIPTTETPTVVPTTETPIPTTETPTVVPTTETPVPITETPTIIPTTETPIPTTETPTLPAGLYVITIPAQTSIFVNDTSLVSVYLNNVPADGLTSAEFTCSYNASLLEVSAIADAGLFGTDAVTALNGPQNGQFIFAVAGSNGRRATISGVALTFTVKGLQSGQSVVECKARVSNGSGALMDITSIPANVTVNPVVPVNGTLTGVVFASKPVTIRLYDALNTLVASIPANVDGSFNVTVPAGTYTVVTASADGFLSAQGTAIIIGGTTSAMPIVALPAGDIDGNNVIDQYDAMTIGMNYNAASPSAADLNNDGIINVLDLELLAANYRKSGALAWQ